MPIYEYECTDENCKKRFEATQKMTDPKLTECPVCRREVRRLISATAPPVFLCSGFGRYSGT